MAPKSPPPPPKLGHQRRRHFIKEWREFRDMTQDELGDRIDVRGATISRIESLEIGYTQDRLEQIADALRTHASTLLSRPPRPEDAEIAADGGRKRTA